MTRIITVFGATGAMGRHVVKHLLADMTTRWHVRAVTRDPGSPQARQLAAHPRVELVRGNLDSDPDVRAALSGADAVFANTDFWSSGSVMAERAQGLRLLRAAEDERVAHFVWSSLEDAAHMSDGTLPVAHFDSKAAVEHEIDWRRSDEFMRQVPGWYRDSVSVLRTTTYFENFMTFLRPRVERLPDGREGLTFWLPVDDARLPMAALDDIGVFACLMLGHPDRWAGRTLRVASDQRTMHEIARTFTEVTGVPARYVPLTRDQWLAGGMPAAHDLWNQFRFHALHGPLRDMDALRALHPRLLDFRTWLERTGWRGEPREVQRSLAVPRSRRGTAQPTARQPA